MRAVVQRVASASVQVGGAAVGSIGRGLCVLVGVTHVDDETSARRMADKLWNLRIFADSQGRTNVSAADLKLPLLVVSQFTLYADTQRGRRPSFAEAASPEVAEELIERLVTFLEEKGASVAQGRFGEHMELTLVNDGPFTLVVVT